MIVYQDKVTPYLRTGQTLLFSHGFNIHIGQSNPPQDIDVALVAPKSPKHLLHQVYKQSPGVPGLLAIHQDATGEA